VEIAIPSFRLGCEPPDDMRLFLRTGGDDIDLLGNIDTRTGAIMGGDAACSDGIFTLVKILVVNARPHLDRIAGGARRIGDGREDCAERMLFLAILHRRAIAVVIDPPRVGVGGISGHARGHRTRLRFRNNNLSHFTSPYFSFSKLQNL
jgi:hypothetical protein